MKFIRRLFRRFSKPPEIPWYIYTVKMSREDIKKKYGL